MLNKIVLVVFILLVIISGIYALKDDRDYTTNSAEAYELFLESRDLASKLYTAESSEKLEKAHKLDTNFAMVLRDLADRKWQIGDRNSAWELLDKAKRNYEDLKKHEQLSIDITELYFNERSDSVIEAGIKRYIDAFPDRKEGHQYLAHHYWRLGEVEKAIQEFERIIEIEPDYAPPYNSLGYLQYSITNFDKAFENFEKYLNLLPDQANPHDSKGEILMALGKYDQALEEFKIAHQIEPRFSFVLYHMADVYMRKGMFKKADQTLNKLEKMASNEYEKFNVTRTRANSYWMRGDYETAQKMSDQILSEVDDEKPDLSKLFWGNVIGGFANLRNDVETSVTYLRTADSLNEKINNYRNEEQMYESTGWLISLDALVNIEQENYEEILELEEMVNDKKIWRPDAILDLKSILATAYYNLDQKDKAYKFLNENLRINPNHFHTLWTFVEIYEEENRIDQAIEKLDKILALFKDADEEFKLLEIFTEKYAELKALAA